MQLQAKHICSNIIVTNQTHHVQRQQHHNVSTNQRNNNPTPAIGLQRSNSHLPVIQRHTPYLQVSTSNQTQRMTTTDYSHNKLRQQQRITTSTDDKTNQLRYNNNLAQQQLWHDNNYRTSTSHKASTQNNHGQNSE